MYKSKNILFLLHLPPPIHGSSKVGMQIKESALINKTFECSYINLLASKNIAESGKVNLRKIIGFIFTFVKVFGSLLTKRPQLCYLSITSTGAAFYKDLLLVTLLKVFRIKLIYHLHNKGVSLHQHKTINRICYRFVYRNADVILLSKRLYSDIQQFVQEYRVHICPNGIKDEGRIATRQELRTKNAVQIMFLSNLIESKGVFILLEACALLKNKEIPFECIYIGGEGDITALNLDKEINKLGLRDHVNYQGKKHGEEKGKAFLEADIFAFPTYYTKECFPLVLLEAMSYSLPVISTFEGGIPDLIEDGVTGFLVQQRDTVALSEKLELLIQNPELRLQMGAAGRTKYEKEFTLEIFENRMVEILNQVIEKNNYDLASQN